MGVVSARGDTIGVCPEIGCGWLQRKTGCTRGVSRSTKKETASAVLNGISTLFQSKKTSEIKFLQPRVSSLCPFSMEAG